MSGSPVDPSNEDVPESTPPTPDEEPTKDAEDPRERVIEAFHSRPHDGQPGRATETEGRENPLATP